jgi:hypothetical protein
VSDGRRFAPAAARNREPICDVLNDVLPATGLVLEIASGTGEHCVHFAERFPSLRFQPSDPDPDSRASIEAWRLHSGLSNVASPLPLDVLDPEWVDAVPDLAALVCINMVHISPWSATLGLLTGAARRLGIGRALYLYGPYRRDGCHTADSNAVFDESLRARHPGWGVRDLESVQGAAARLGFTTDAVVEMPANNLSVVLRRI